jgi:hypothetical protein
MGGLGSGRPNSGAPTCEGCLGIDLAWLRRRGMLQLGRHSAVTWSRSGEQTGSITLAAESDGVRLIYRTTDRDARPFHLHAHHVRRPPAVAPLPEVRQGMPEDLRKALFPMPNSRPNRRGCAGRHTTASWSSTTSWKTPRMIDGPFAS